MQARMKNLLVVAHPDDETIFFTSAILNQPEYEWSIACVTDANADGEGARRKSQFERACKELKASQCYWFNLPDIYETRLNLDQIQSNLAKIPTPHHVYTHGPLGEYMHPHHQDVCYAVTKFYAPICPTYVTAYNAFPEKRFLLSKEQFELRTHILSEIYSSETMRFINMLPARSCDEFIMAPLDEIEALYKLLAHHELKQLDKLKIYKWLRYFLEEKANNPGSRPF